jgi:ABC-2 type transport system ATP-binding protein
MASTGVIHDTAVLPGWMKVDEVLAFIEAVHPNFHRQIALDYLKRTTIPLSQKVKNLSKGMKTQLHLSLVLATDSRILILDEPTHGLDILFRKQLYSSVLEDYFDEEKSIIISTHQIEEVEHILSDVIFIKDGRVLLYDSMSNLADRFCQVAIHGEDEEKLKSVAKPISEYSILGRKVFLVENGDRKALAELGDVNTPSVADIFVALMAEPTENQGGAA